MATSIDIGQMFVNLSKSYDPIMKMLTGGTYVMGFAFSVAGILALKQLGESKSMSNSGSFKAPIIYFIVGAVFLYLPSSINVFMQTFYDSNVSPISYGDTVLSGLPANVTQSVLRLVQIIGLISFIRGWVILSHAAKSGGQPQVGKALTHIIGGVLAINIVGTKAVLSATFGF